MIDEPRVRQLVDELLDSERTPEEICADCPELLPEVRKRSQEMLRAVEAELDALFPTPGHNREADTPAPWNAATGLPDIPGYQVEAVLGRGGVGIVYKARHVRLNRPVAVKMLLAGAYAGPEKLARFRREAEAVAVLRHPNIVQVHDAGEVAGHPYFTMECVEGGTLAGRLAGRPQPPRRAAELVATLASAVQFAHQSGFIHRDLKPVNVLLTADGVPKITDFGLARSINAGPGVTRSGDCLGTPHYMAPEQARGHAGAVGPAADIYALGAVLYEMLAGRPPFDGETAAEVIHKVMAEEPAPPSRRNAKVPRDLETICLKCLQKSPARRYASAQDLADDLHRFLDGKPVRARPVGAAERVLKWARRRPAVALLLAALVVMLTAATGTGVWMQQQESDRRAAQEQRVTQAREVVETALSRANDLRPEERWKEALVVLTDAAPHLAETNSPLLEQKLTQAQSDFRIADALASVRESNPFMPNGWNVDYARWAEEDRTAFEYVGLRTDDDAEMLAQSIRVSAIHDQLVAAIEDRAFVAFMLNDGPLVERLLQIARLADPGSPWRERFRDPAAWGNVAQLQELAAGAIASSPPPSEHQLALLGQLLWRAGARSHATQLLGEVCRLQPRNFWAHREMGFALYMKGRYLESAGYYRVAVTLRPDNLGVLERLGLALIYAGQRDEAVAVYRQALKLSPKSTAVRAYLVYALAETGYWKDAEAECRRGLEIDPVGHAPLFRLVQALGSQERSEEALAPCRKVTELAPNFADAHGVLGSLYARTARHEDAVTELRTAMGLRGGLPLDCMLAHELAVLGRLEEAIAVLQAAATREPTNAVYPFEMGKIFRSHGKAGEAAKAFQKVTTLQPRYTFVWEELAESLLDQGRFGEARAAIESHLALGIAGAERRAELRRLELCKAMLAVEANLPAILAGKELPENASAQRALAEWCLKHKRFTATAANFYASALTLQPSLADDLEAGNRLDAARAAALAGCGVGADADQLDGHRRAELRKQSLDWLTAEYNAWAERHRLGKPADRTVAAKAVRSWLKPSELDVSPWMLVSLRRVDAYSRPAEDLASVRDQQALAKLPPAERLAWQALWVKVATLAAREPGAQFAEARAHVARLEWGKAAACYAAGMELEPTQNDDLWFEYAAAQLLSGDRQAYHRACAHMLSRCQPKGPMRPYLVARACTLAPDGTDDPAQPTLLLTDTVTDTVFNGGESWVLAEKAALSFRAGDAKLALLYAEGSLAGDNRPGSAVLNWLRLALAYQKLGNPKEAKRWLDKAAYWLNQQGGRMPLNTNYMGATLHNWLEAHVLRQEAEAQIR